MSDSSDINDSNAFRAVGKSLPLGRRFAFNNHLIIPAKAGIYLVFWLLLMVVGTAEAQWSRDPREAIELPDVYNVNLTTDSLGGVFIDGWAASSDLKTYCLWLDSDGVRHWNNWIDVSPRASETHSSAIALCSEPGQLVVAYEAYWFGEDTIQDVRIQKINTQGELLWPDSGVAVSSISFRLEHNQEFDYDWYPGKIVIFGMVSDGEGGIIVAYTVTHYDPYQPWNAAEQLIYAQRISSEGDLLWGEDGIQIVEREERVFTQGGVVSDNDGGVIVKYLINWATGLFGAQRINRNGERLWSDGGGTHEVGYSFGIYAVVSDLRGGAILTGLMRRQDGRNKIGLFHFNNEGDQVWGENEGIVIKDEPYQAGLTDHQLIQASDSVWFVTWEASGDYQPYPLIQSINLEGELGWDIPGIRVSEGDSSQIRCTGVKSKNSAIFIWKDSRDTLGVDFVVRAQRVDTEGNRLWGNGDILLFAQTGMAITDIESDISGGAFIYMWNNIGYLQYINADGELGIPLRVSNPGEPLDQRVLTYQIFPNPANQTATIFLSSPNVIQTTLSIHDLQGRLIQTNPILPNQVNVPVNLQSFSSGQYLIQIESAEKSKAQFLQIMK